MRLKHHNHQIIVKWIIQLKFKRKGCPLARIQRAEIFYTCHCLEASLTNPNGGTLWESSRRARDLRIAYLIIIPKSLATNSLIKWSNKSYNKNCIFNRPVLILCWSSPHTLNYDWNLEAYHSLLENRLLAPLNHI